MRGLVSLTVIVLAGCALEPKPPATVEVNAVPQAPMPGPSPPAPSPPAVSSAASPLDTPPTESVAPSTTAPPPVPDPSPPATAPAPTGAERECAARGGTIQPVCMLGELACVIRYRDGGKLCCDKRDCTGECLYEGPEPPPAKAPGKCARTSDPCGCKALIHHGQVEPTLCAD